MRVLPTSEVNPHDWLVTIHYRNSHKQKCKAQIAVAPVSRTDEQWHLTPREFAIRKALNSVIWGRDVHYSKRFMMAIHLSERPDDVIGIEVIRRHQKPGCTKNTLDVQAQRVRNEQKLLQVIGAAR